MVAQVTRRESRQFQFEPGQLCRAPGGLGSRARLGTVPPHLDMPLGPPNTPALDVRVRRQHPPPKDQRSDGGPADAPV